MVKKCFLRPIAAVTAASLLVASAPAAAQDAPKGAEAPKISKAAEAEAKARFNRGMQLYQEGDYKLALIEFRRANELNPSYRIFYNIGYVNVLLGNYADALRAFEKYLQEGGNEIPAKRRAEVEREIQNVRNRTAHVEIVTDVEGADVFIDDMPIGKTPLSEKLLVSAGQHKFTISKPGHTTATRYVTLAGLDETRVEVDLPELPRQDTPVVVAPAPASSDSPSTGAPPPAAPPPDAPPARSNTWIGWVATGGLTAGAVATGIAALSSAAKYDDLRNTAGTPAAALDDQRGDARTLALTADVLTAAAVLVGGVTLYMTLSTPARPETRGRLPKRSLTLGLGPGSARIGGSF